MIYLKSGNGSSSSAKNCCYRSSANWVLLTHRLMNDFSCHAGSRRITRSLEGYLFR